MAVEQAPDDFPDTSSSVKAGHSRKAQVEGGSLAGKNLDFLVRMSHVTRIAKSLAEEILCVRIYRCG